MPEIIYIVTRLDSEEILTAQTSKHEAIELADYFTSATKHTYVVHSYRLSLWAYATEPRKDIS